MGLSLTLNVFADVDAPAVYGALATFFETRGASLVAETDRQKRFDLHERHSRWSVLEWELAGDWKLWQQAQLHVSRQLGVAGLLVFVYDGDCWGYELFDRGEVLDHFEQLIESAPMAFPGEDCLGNAATLARALRMAEADVAPYLEQPPEDEEEHDRLDVPARPGDEFTRFSECAVLDFLRAIGVEVGLDDGWVKFASPICRSFRPSFGS